MDNYIFFEDSWNVNSTPNSEDINDGSEQS